MTDHDPTCNFSLTGQAGRCRHDGRDGTDGGRWLLTSEELLGLLAAIGHAQRLRIIAELSGGRVHVSELARRLGLSRPLLYMHLDRLEKAGLVVGQLELSADGKAMKYFDVVPFDLHLTVDAVLEALAQDAAVTTPPGAGNPPAETPSAGNPPAETSPG